MTGQRRWIFPNNTGDRVKLILFLISISSILSIVRLHRESFGGVIYNPDSFDLQELETAYNHVSQSNPLQSEIESSTAANKNLTNDDNSTVANIEGQSIDCGCPHICDEASLMNKGKEGNQRCGKRIKWLMKKYGMNETDSCTHASKDNGPCGQECNPRVCVDMTEKPKVSNVQVSHLQETLQDTQKNFTRHNGVAIVTKVLNSDAAKILKEMICLINAAYNRHVNYDFVVFTTLPWPEETIKEVQEMAAPSNLVVVMDGPSLQGHLDAMDAEEVKFLKERCGDKPDDPLYWNHYCTEPDARHTNSLAYSWQSEFRAARIYTHPALLKYKYMIWMDTDALCTKDWEVDPIQVVVDNDLVILFDTFGYGTTRNNKFKQKMLDVYEKTICSVKLAPAGHLVPKECGPEQNVAVEQIGGYNHITNLDIYRKDIHQKFLSNLVGDYRFSRQWDDQLGVTIPAVVEAPERSWDARANGINLGIRHHNQLDGKEGRQYKNKLNDWKKAIAPAWEAGRIMCDHVMRK
jgi:hypothetical protein